MELTKKQKKEVKRFMGIYLHDFIDRELDEATKSFIEAVEKMNCGDSYVVTLKFEFDPGAIRLLRFSFQAQQEKP